MSYNKHSSSAVALSLLLALVAVPKPTVAISSINPVLAQSVTPTPFPLPDSVAEGTTVRIDGSNSMAAVNQSLKQRFEGQYAGTQIEEAYNGTTAALQSLLEGNIDLAAIGRPLTDEEKAQGLTEVTVGRSKIAIIVSEDNPFDGNLTFEQFAQIFRGEITDWSEVGGEPVPIRLVDQSPDSDTRQAFSRYPVFQNAPFETGTTAVQLDDDSADAIVSELGSDGIGYITANQVVDRPGVRIIPMHQTLPTDPRYPYSQPLVYAYRGEPSPAVAAFLGFAAAPVGQAAVAEVGAAIVSNPDTTAQAPIAEPTTSPETTASPSPDAAAVPPTSTEATVGAERRGAPWLWLLPLLLGIPLLWWLLGRRRGTAPVEELPPATPPVAAESTAPTLADRTGTVVSADRTSIAETRLPASVLPETSPDPVAGIPPVDPTVTPPVVNATLAAGAALAGGATLAGLAGSDRAKKLNRIILTPRTTSQAYAYWEAPEENRQELRRQGGKRYTLRIYDVTDIDLERQPPHSIQEFVCQETDQDRLVSHLQSDRDYIAEIGYFTDDNQWLSLARSAPIQMPSVNPLLAENAPEVPPVIAPAVAASTAVAGATWFNPNSTASNGQQETVEAAKFNVGQPDLRGEDLADVDANLPALADGYGDSQIFLLPRDPNWAYTYWDVPNEHKEALRREGGSRLALRFFDVTGIDLEQQRPHSLQQYDCDELSRDWYLPVPISDRDYLVEIGYLTNDGRWLMLARSNPVRIPPMYPTDWLDDQFVTVDWQEDLCGKTQLELPQPTATSYNNPISDRIFNLVKQAEAQRVAGSVFGSMQQVPQQSLSSYSVSGLGMAARTESGIGFMSGIGMAGMSGAGVTGMSSVGAMSGAGAVSMSGVGMSGIGIGVAGMSGIGMSGIGSSGIQTTSGVGMSGIGMSGVGLSGIGIAMMSGIGVSGASGIGAIGMSGIGLISGVGMSGVGMSGMGMGYLMSGVGMSGIGMVGISTMSGIGYTMSGIGMSGIGPYNIPTMSGVGMSGIGMGLSMSGGGMSGIGMSGTGMGYTMSGVGMSGVGMYGIPAMSGVGMSGVGMGLTMSGVGMSGIGMYSIPTLSGIGMSGAGMGYMMSGMGMSGIGMSGVGFGASIPPIRPRKFWLVANAELIVHGATEPDATVRVGDREIKLSPDGTFRFQVAFPDGDINYPVLAIAADGEQTRSIRMDFNRETPVNNGNTKESAVEEWLQ